MLERHPAIVWAGILVTVVSLGAGIGAGWYYILDERERSIQQSATLADVRSEQEQIRRELGLQTSDLDSIRVTQGSFNELRTEHRWLATQIWQASCHGGGASNDQSR